jgi:hypothetical protein
MEEIDMSAKRELLFFIAIVFCAFIPTCLCAL